MCALLFVRILVTAFLDMVASPTEWIVRYVLCVYTVVCIFRVFNARWLIHVRMTVSATMVASCVRWVMSVRQPSWNVCPVGKRCLISFRALVACIHRSIASRCVLNSFWYSCSRSRFSCRFCCGCLCVVLCVCACVCVCVCVCACACTDQSIERRMD